jgi:hypothetical protein
MLPQNKTGSNPDSHGIGRFARLGAIALGLFQLGHGLPGKHWRSRGPPSPYNMLNKHHRQNQSVEQNLQSQGPTFCVCMFQHMCGKACLTVMGPKTRLLHCCCIAAAGLAPSQQRTAAASLPLLV